MMMMMIILIDSSSFEFRVKRVQRLFGDVDGDWKLD